MACFGAISPNVLLILHRQKKNHRNNRMIVAAALPFEILVYTQFYTSGISSKEVKGIPSSFSARSNFSAMPGTPYTCNVSIKES